VGRQSGPFCTVESFKKFDTRRTRLKTRQRRPVRDFSSFTSSVSGNGGRGEDRETSKSAAVGSVRHCPVLFRNFSGFRSTRLSGLFRKKDDLKGFRLTSTTWHDGDAIIFCTLLFVPPPPLSSNGHSLTVVGLLSLTPLISGILFFSRLTLLTQTVDSSDVLLTFPPLR